MYLQSPMMSEIIHEVLVVYGVDLWTFHLALSLSKSVVEFFLGFHLQPSWCCQ